jgi:peptidoglycan glycosyltransferase
VNSRIRQLFGLLILLFGLLVGFTSYWSIFDADGLKANKANKRLLLEEQRIRRGLIFAGDGTVLARNRISGDGSARFFSRFYPTGSLFSHAVGYNFVRQGRAGLERSYNADLTDERDEFQTILDQIRGQQREGNDVVTTLDPAGQRTAVSALAGRAGAVVALEPQTGRVRVMASVPSFDTNAIPSEFSRLNRAPGAPLFDRATQSGYPPGSTFKVVTAAAALDSGKFTPQSALSGRSPRVIDGVPLRNFGGESFGSIDLTTALTHSVNTVWAQVGERLGKRTMLDYMSRFGFNRRPKIDLPRDEVRASGVVQGGKLLDDSDSIDIGRVAIGQERLLVTPLQMAMVVAAIGNGGKLERPHLVDRIRDPDGKTIRRIKPSQESDVMRPATAQALASMMSQVVKEGTGTAAALQGIDVAGKTGTAEVGGSVNQAWFIAFAPVSSPRIAVAVTVERTTGQGGTVAAPIAKQVMEALLR